eukprot:ANDGO_03329.mRNA.1 putative ATP-dependent RNA helicase spindle-E
MGVYGLSAYLKKNASSVFDPVTLPAEPQQLLVDWNGIVFYLMEQHENKHAKTTLGIEPFITNVFGGDPVFLANGIVSFFQPFLDRKHQVSCYLDGPQHSYVGFQFKKQQTMFDRASDEVNVAKKIYQILRSGQIPKSQSRLRARLFQLCSAAKYLASATLRKLGVKFVQCEGEADIEIRKDFERLQAFAVIGFDSDFVMMRGVRYIPLDTVSFKNQAITAKLVTGERVASLLGIAYERLPDLAALCGNDATKPMMTHYKIWEQIGLLRGDIEGIANFLKEVPDQLFLNVPRISKLLSRDVSFRSAVLWTYEFYGFENPQGLHVSHHPSPEKGTPLVDNVLFSSVRRLPQKWFAHDPSPVTVSEMQGRGSVLSEFMIPFWKTMGEFSGSPSVEFFYRVKEKFGSRQVPCSGNRSVAETLFSELQASKAARQRFMFMFCTAWLKSPASVAEVLHLNLVGEFRHRFPFMSDERFLSFCAFSCLLLSLNIVCKTFSFSISRQEVEIMLFVLALGVWRHPVSLDSSSALKDIPKGAGDMYARSFFLTSALRSLLSLHSELEDEIVEGEQSIADESPNFNLLACLLVESYQGTNRTIPAEFSLLRMSCSQFVDRLCFLSREQLDYDILPIPFAETEVDVDESEAAAVDSLDEAFASVLVFDDDDNENNQNDGMFGDNQFSPEDDDDAILENPNPKPEIVVHLHQPKISATQLPVATPGVLPIHSFKDSLLKEIEARRVVCIQGETGCGKSTGVPIFLYNSSPKNRILVTQPRRLAARSLASHVATLVGTKLGDAVGYRVGSDALVSRNTRLQYVTTGYLVSWLMHYPEQLFSFSHIVLDEVHERSADSDFLSLIIKTICSSQSGKDQPFQTKIIIMSATIQAELFSSYFSFMDRTPSQPVFVGARRYPVQECFLEDFDPLIQSDDRASKSYVRLVQKFRNLVKRPGSFQVDQEIVSLSLELICALIRSIHKLGICILVFLPGAQEIQEMETLLRQIFDDDHTKINVLHSLCADDEQSDALRSLSEIEAETGIMPCKIVLSTNIAETSLTIPDVTVVVDSGLARQIVYDGSSGNQLLKTVFISRASAHQRTGRTGRLAPGTVYRAYTKSFMGLIPPFDDPEVLRMPLEKLVLDCFTYLAPFGNPLSLLMNLLQPPSWSSLQEALVRLRLRGAMTGSSSENDSNVKLTRLGLLASSLSSVGCDVDCAYLILMGLSTGFIADAIILVACIRSERDLFLQPSLLFLKKFSDYSRKVLANFDHRYRFDHGRQSELLSLRDLYLEWLAHGSHDHWAVANGASFRSLKALDHVVESLASTLHSSLFASRGAHQSDAFAGLHFVNSTWKDSICASLRLLSNRKSRFSGHSLFIPASKIPTAAMSTKLVFCEDSSFLSVMFGMCFHQSYLFSGTSKAIGTVAKRFVAVHALRFPQAPSLAASAIRKRVVRFQGVSPFVRQNPEFVEKTLASMGFHVEKVLVDDKALLVLFGSAADADASKAVGVGARLDDCIGDIKRLSQLSHKAVCYLPKTVDSQAFRTSHSVVAAAEDADGDNALEDLKTDKASLTTMLDSQAEKLGNLECECVVRWRWTQSPAINARTNWRSPIGLLCSHHAEATLYAVSATVHLYQPLQGPTMGFISTFALLPANPRGLTPLILSALVPKEYQTKFQVVIDDDYGLDRSFSKCEISDDDDDDDDNDNDNDDFPVGNSASRDPQFEKNSVQVFVSRDMRTVFAMRTSKMIFNFHQSVDFNAYLSDINVIRKVVSELFNPDAVAVCGSFSASFSEFLAKYTAILTPPHDPRLEKGAYWIHLEFEDFDRCFLPPLLIAKQKAQHPKSAVSSVLPQSLSASVDVGSNCGDPQSQEAIAAALASVGTMRPFITLSPYWDFLHDKLSATDTASVLTLHSDCEEKLRQHYPGLAPGMADACFANWLSLLRPTVVLKVFYAFHSGANVTITRKRLPGFAYGISRYEFLLQNRRLESLKFQIATFTRLVEQASNLEYELFMLNSSIFLQLISVYGGVSGSGGAPVRHFDVSSYFKIPVKQFKVVIQQYRVPDDIALDKTETDFINVVPTEVSPIALSALMIMHNQSGAELILSYTAQGWDVSVNLLMLCLGDVVPDSFHSRLFSSHFRDQLAATRRERAPLPLHVPKMRKGRRESRDPVSSPSAVSGSRTGRPAK